jgi:hypothetical protein
MRNKPTAPRTTKHRKASSLKKSGLIVNDKTAGQSAASKCAVDNRSHRTPFVVATVNTPALLSGPSGACRCVSG